MIKILLVDDDFSVRDTMKDFLEFFVDEIKIDLARHGAEGLAMLKKDRYDILISDQMMPDMKGSEFIAKAIDKLREDKTEIYIYSGQLLGELTVQLADYGEVQIIDKFTSPMFFKDIIEQYRLKQ
jgi:CheY-like chemotaxis protein